MFKKAIHVLILISILMVFFFDVVFLGKTLSSASLVYNIIKPEDTSNLKPFTFDVAGDALVNEPTSYIIRRLLNETTFPLWNPYEGLGSPLIGNLNNEVFNPLKIMLNIHPSPLLKDLILILRLFFDGALCLSLSQGKRAIHYPITFGCLLFHAFRIFNLVG